MKHFEITRTAAAAALLACGLGAQAADWSDTSIGYRYGTDFAEPKNPNKISKDILNLTHVSGYKYGTNFFNADLLMSDDKDPGGKNATNGAQVADGLGSVPEVPKVVERVQPVKPVEPVQPTVATPASGKLPHAPALTGMGAHTPGVGAGDPS